MGLTAILAGGSPDSARAGEVLLRWTVPQGWSLAGYRVHLGGAVREYRTHVDLAAAGVATASGIAGVVLDDVPSPPVHVAVSAVTVTGLESDYSNEKVLSAPLGPPPPAEAGPDVEGLVGQALRVGSTPTAGAVYLWRQVDGPAPLAIAAPFASATTVRASRAGTYELEVVAADGQGYARRDRVVLTVLPGPPGAATPTPTPTPRPPVGDATVGGQVVYHATGAGVGGVEVAALVPGPGGGAETAASAWTDGDGWFGLGGDVPSDAWIRPQRGDPASDAVTALDAAHVLQALTGSRTLTAGEMLACDASGNGTLSALDAALILQAVVGLRSRLPVVETCGSAWLFQPRLEAVPGLVRPARVAAGGCEHGAVRADLAAVASPLFVDAVLLGDCSGNWAEAERAAFHAEAFPAVDVSVRRVNRHDVAAVLRVAGDAPVHALTAQFRAAGRLLRARVRGRPDVVLRGTGPDGAGRLRFALAAAGPLNGAGPAQVEMLVRMAGSGEMHLEWVRFDEGAVWWAHPAGVTGGR